MKHHEDKVFNAAELPPEGFAGAEFERCTFRNGRWMEADLQKAIFTECTFEQCDLSNARVDRTGFRQVVFRGCKLIGVPFDRSHPFLLALRFEQCRLDFAIFPVTSAEEHGLPRLFIGGGRSQWNRTSTSRIG
jgi:uncharacterized protein YjbI with pentapeptide repeats